MELIGQGILLGLGLSVLVGPILVIYMQYGIERGFKAGISAALGVWVSDFLFILAMYFGLHYIQKLISLQGFEHWMSLGGAFVIVLLALSMLLQRNRDIALDQTVLNNKTRSYLGYFLKGFLVNTLNPFPFFFWSSVMTGYFSKSQELSSVILLFGSIMGTIMITDFLKVYLAKKLQTILTPVNIHRLRYVSGFILLFLGFFLGASVFFSF